MVARFFILVSRFVELCDKKLSCIVRRESNDSFKESSATLLIVIALVTYNISNLMLQKAFSESSALILFMTSYLVFNDDLLVLNFSSFNNSITNDYFAFFTKILICLFSAFYFLIVSNFLKEQKITSFEFFLIILLAILGILLMCSSNDFLTAYLAVELSSLAFYILASFRKSSSYSVESGIKYFVTGAVSSAFFLLGSSFIYGLTGSINFSDFHDLFECLSFYFYTDDSFYHYVSPEMDRYWSLVQLITLFSVNDSLDFSGLFDHSFVEFGLTLILFSLFIKLSLAPFHLWSLDVYEGAPTSSTVFFAVITKLRCEVTRVCSVQSRILFPLRFVVFAFMFSSDYVKRSNNMYSTVNRIGTISLTLFCGGSFLIKWLDYTLKSYLRLEILNNIKEDPLWKNISKISECSNSIRIPIYQLARSTARRFSINLKKASCETFKIGCNLKTIEKIIPFGLKATMMLKKSRGFSSRPNMKGTTSDEQIKFVHAIHKCWDKKCRKYKNLYQVIFAEETLQKAYKKISTRRIILTEVNAKEKMDSFDFGIFKNISSQLFKSCYKFSSFKSRVISYKNKTEECSFTVISFWDKVVVHAVYIVLKEVYDS